VDLVVQLYRAIQANRKRQMVETATAFSVAVCNALDMAFAKGKGKILEQWSKAMLQEKGFQEDKPKKAMSEETFSFLISSLPTERG